MLLDVSFRKMLFAAFIGQLSLSPALAFYGDYLPAQLSKHTKIFAQKLVKEDIGHEWAAEPIPGVSVRTNENKITISGTSKKQSAFSVDVGEDYMDGSCYLADVDKNGQQDLIFHFSNGSCGMPTSSVAIVMFDSEGIPHPYENLSRFDADNKGVSDLVNAEDGKGALLIQQDMVQRSTPKRDFSYWRWTVSQAKDCKMVELKTLYGTNLPSFVFFTQKPNHKLSKITETLEQLYQKNIASRQKN